MFKEVLLAVCVAFLTGCSSMSISNNVSSKELADKTVMITNGSGGGSGVILKSTQRGSLILTNRHICEGVSEGGTVQSNKVKAAVVAMKPSKVHDLCLIRVGQDMGVNTKVADRAGKNLETSIVSGHPQLLPNIINTGHFAGYMDVEMMVGILDCDGDETSEEDILTCAIFGKKALMQKFETQVISNIIAPGNSGSAVFNSKGEVVNLVFAGYGRTLSYGITVPNSYIQDFLKDELKTLEWQRPAPKKVVKDEADSNE